MLLGAAVGLAAGHTLAVVLREVLFPGRNLLGVGRFLSLGEEANLPTYWNALLLLGCALQLYWVSWIRRLDGDRFDSHWRFLGHGFAFLSLDEAAQFHEGLVGQAIRATVGAGEGIASYVWYFAYLPIAAGVGVAYLGFLRSLPRRLSRLFVLSAGLYLSGALGMEMIEASVVSSQGTRLAVAVTQGLEETLEIVGVSLFFYSLWSYVGHTGRPIHLGSEP